MDITTEKKNSTSLQCKTNYGKQLENSINTPKTENKMITVYNLTNYKHTTLQEIKILIQGKSMSYTREITRRLKPNFHKMNPICVDTSSLYNKTSK